jgi:hypothetical protein
MTKDVKIYNQSSSEVDADYLAESQQLSQRHTPYIKNMPVA